MAQKGFFSFYNMIKHYSESYFDRKELKKKNSFFDQNHGLTRFEKYDCWDFERLHFFRAKKAFFSISHTNIISGLILTENNSRKKMHFLIKSMG